MVWNLSGSADYEAAAFAGVVQLRFGGHLCPPLLMLVEACVSMHAWLAADAANAVVVHCRTGRGRSAVLLCCLLAWRAVHEGAGSPHPLDWASALAIRRAAANLPWHIRIN